MSSTRETWTVVGALDDIPIRGARVVRTIFGDVGVFRTVENKVFAIEDRCPHEGGPLSQGIVHGTQVTCPLHNWIIDLKSGGVIGPDEGCVTVIPVKISDGRILLDLSVLSDCAA